MRRSIAPHRLEWDEDAPVGAEAEAVLGERGAEEIATELLQAGAIVGGHPEVGVEVEAVQLGLTRAAGGDVTEARLVTEAADAGAGAGAEGDPALDGGPNEADQDGGDFGERVRRGRVVGGLWRASSCPTRARRVARTCATPSSLGGVARAGSGSNAQRWWSSSWPRTTS